MKSIDKTLKKQYTLDKLNNASFHVFEKGYNRLNKHEINVLYLWIKRHQNLM